MSSNSIYTIPYTYLIGWSSLDLYYYGRRTAQGCNPSDLFESYFTSSKSVKAYIEQYGAPDVILVRQTFDDPVDCARWECKVLRRLDVKNHKQMLNKVNGDFAWDYTDVDSIWMSKNGTSKRVLREQSADYLSDGWTEGRAVDWTWVKRRKESKRVSSDEIAGYLENGWHAGRLIDHAGENNPMYGKKGKDTPNFKGYWHTPFGIFERLDDAANELKVSYGSLYRICMNPNDVVTVHGYNISKILRHLFDKEECVGKTYRELGFKREE